MGRPVGSSVLFPIGANAPRGLSSEVPAPRTGQPSAAGGLDMAVLEPRHSTPSVATIAAELVNVRLHSPSDDGIVVEGSGRKALSHGQPPRAGLSAGPSRSRS